MLLVLVALLCAAGCISKRIVWSPDGKQAVVLGDEGLFLSDSEGNVSPLLVPAVSGAAWFPDGSKLALAKSEKFERWSDLRQNLTADQRKEVEESAQNLLRKVKTGTAWEQVASEVKSEDNLVDGQFNAALLCLRDEYGSQLTEKFSPILDSLKETRAEASSLYIGVVQTNQITLGRKLATEPGYIWEIRVAPSGAGIAYATFPDNGRQTSKLVAVPVGESGSPQILAKEAGSYPDWSADGKSLLYIQAIGMPHSKDELRLGALIRRGILNDAGQWEVSPNPESLVGVLFSEGAKVRCLSDGRIIFWSLEVHLPATKLEMPQRHQLFVYDPLRMAAVAPLIPRGVQQQLPDALVFSEISPDEKRIAIGDEKGRIFVFTIATGNVQTVQSIEDDLKTIPVWRSADELTFIMPNVVQEGGTPSRPEVALWTPKQTRFLSKQWPENLRKGLLNN